MRNLLTYLLTYLLNAATHLRRGGKFYSVFFCSSSQNAGVKELLKSVHIRHQSYHKNTALVFFDSRRILFQTVRNLHKEMTLEHRNTQS